MICIAKILVMNRAEKDQAWLKTELQPESEQAAGNRFDWKKKIGQ